MNLNYSLFVASTNLQQKFINQLLVFLHENEKHCADGKDQKLFFYGNKNNFYKSKCNTNYKLFQRHQILIQT